jgi:hypothetical protein
MERGGIFICRKKAQKAQKEFCEFCVFLRPNLLERSITVAFLPENRVE